METHRRSCPLRIAVAAATPRPVAVPGLASWMLRVAPARARGEVSIVFVTDARMRKLNREYRGEDKATDVLSFPAHPSHRPLFGALGDIVIAAGVAARQAKAAGHSFGTEARVLALHGLLHLMGYDHETDNGQMARLEARLRRQGGLREGLIARARTAAR
jgi:probable rRNA maturation factor